MGSNQPQNTSIVKQDEPLEEFLARPEIVNQFISLFGSDGPAKRYVRSVAILVSMSDPGEYSLRNCTNLSIFNSALRAATLRVSLDPALRQAYLVPRHNKKNNGALEANLQLHYAEIRNRAMRTGRYSFINVSPIYEGEVVTVNIYSGIHQVILKNGLVTAPTQRDGFVPVSERRGRVIGWLGYFRTTKGAEQTVYMSIEDIIAHVTIYNPSWAGSSSWKNNRVAMERKTVLLALLRQADLGDPDMAEVRDIIHGDATFQEDEDILDAEVSESDFGDGENQENSEQRAETTQKQTPATPKSAAAPVAPAAQNKPEGLTSERPYAPEVFREKFLAATQVITDKHAQSGKPLEATNADRSLVAACLDTVLGKSKVYRYEFCEWLVGVKSTADMTPAQIHTFLVLTGVKDYKSPCNPITAQEIVGCHKFILAMKENIPA